MSEVESLYQQLILEHSRNPRRFGPLPTASHHARQDNPFCGDSIAVALELSADGIVDVHFEGDGCAIAIAAASMMTEAVTGCSVPQAQQLAGRFCAFVSGQAGPQDLADRAELNAFAAVASFPVRVECAQLPWRALMTALTGAGPAPPSAIRASDAND
jgi:nitrogen fixation protein NifU and related proteins